MVNDLDEAQFPGSGHDNRAGSLGSGTSSRVFVAGNANGDYAQVNSRGVRVSRALFQNTKYYYRINNDSACDSGGAVTGNLCYRYLGSMGTTYTMSRSPRIRRIPALSHGPKFPGRAELAWPIRKQAWANVR